MGAQPPFLVMLESIFPQVDEVAWYKAHVMHVQALVGGELWVETVHNFVLPLRARSPDLPELVGQLGAQSDMGAVGFTQGGDGAAVSLRCDHVLAIHISSAAFELEEHFHVAPLPVRDGVAIPHSLALLVDVERVAAFESLPVEQKRAAAIAKGVVHSAVAGGSTLEHAAALILLAGEPALGTLLAQGGDRLRG